jgi:hypothetical protein
MIFERPASSYRERKKHNQPIDPQQQPITKPREREKRKRDNVSSPLKSKVEKCPNTMCVLDILVNQERKKKKKGMRKSAVIKKKNFTMI